MAETNETRRVAGVISSIETLEGEGFLVHRPFPTYALSDFDPFLLLDEMGPKDLAPGEAKGAPDHPHRGFETVTYMLEGRMQHKDSQGNSGSLTPGDVQWMTAGSGVVHSEMPEAEFRRSGGRLHGFQLWVNLPRADKMIRPRYQEIPDSRIPVAHAKDGLVTVKVIAGEALGTNAVIETRTPIIYLHFTVKPGGRVSQRVPAEYNGFGYVVSGQGLFGADLERATRGQMVMFENNADEVVIENPADAGTPLDVLLIAGIPLREPVVRYGPFVMNTREEIYQAVEDYQNGRMGEIKAQKLVTALSTSSVEDSMSSPAPERMLQRLSNLRQKLLRLHKILLDSERDAYEKARGRVSSGELLQLVINHEQFAWLRSISELIVRVDELMDAKEPMTTSDAETILGEAATLLSPSESGNTFQRRYFAALQAEPDAVLAHREVMQVLSDGP